jgi:hypothetical protein
MSTGTKAPLMDIGLFLCGRRPTAGCQEPGCTRPEVGTCQFELKGRKDGQRCGRRMCRTHVNHDAAGRPICGSHARFVVKEAAAALASMPGDDEPGAA